MAKAPPGRNDVMFPVHTQGQALAVKVKILVFIYFICGYVI